MSTKGAIVDNMSKKYTIVHKSPDDNEDNFEGGGGEQPGSKVTVIDIEDLLNDCVKETEDHLNRRFLGNHKDFNNG